MGVRSSRRPPRAAPGSPPEAVAFATSHEQVMAVVGLCREHRVPLVARGRGTGEMIGDVLEENVRMLALCRELGFTVAPQEDMHGVMRVSVKLS